MIDQDAQDEDDQPATQQQHEAPPHAAPQQTSAGSSNDHFMEMARELARGMRSHAGMDNILVMDADGMITSVAAKLVKERENKGEKKSKNQKRKEREMAKKGKGKGNEEEKEEEDVDELAKLLTDMMKTANEQQSKQQMWENFESCKLTKRKVLNLIICVIYADRMPSLLKILILSYFLNATGIKKWARDGRGMPAVDDDLETPFQLYPEENCESLIVNQLMPNLMLAKQAIEQADSGEVANMQMCDIIISVVAATDVATAHMNMTEDDEPEAINGDVHELIDEIYQSGDLSWFAGRNWLHEHFTDIMDRAQLLQTWQQKGKGKGKSNVAE